MTLQEAKKIFSETCGYTEIKCIGGNPSEYTKTDSILLDGRFTMQELEAIIILKREELKDA